jgi:hypothetical protein
VYHLREIGQKEVVYARHKSKLLRKGVIGNLACFNNNKQAYRLLKEGTKHITVLKDLRFMKTTLDTGAETWFEKLGTEIAHYSHPLGVLTA